MMTAPKRSSALNSGLWRRQIGTCSNFATSSTAAFTVTATFQIGTCSNLIYAISLFLGDFICTWMHKRRLNQTLRQHGLRHLLCFGFKPLAGNPSNLSDTPCHGSLRTLCELREVAQAFSAKADSLLVSVKQTARSPGSGRLTLVEVL